MNLKWPNEIVYQIFPERWLNGDPSNDPRTGEYRWNKKSIVRTDSLSKLTAPRLHQRHFFGGDLAGVTRSIPYLRDLGVTAVYLTPIFKARSSHKYDTDDYLAIDPHFGTRADYEEMVRQLRAAGMKLILDGVFNHTSFHHPWYVRLATRRKFYYMKDRRRTMTWMNGSSLPKLNPEHPAVERELLRVVDAWPEVAGWRLDAAHLLPVTFLKKLKKKIEAVTSDGIVIMEDWNDSSGHFSDGICDGVTNFLFRDALERFFVEDCSAETLMKRLAAWIHRYPWPNVVQSWNHLDNHDTARFLNRIGGRRDRLKLAQVLQFTLPGTPMLYQGDEIGMTGENDADARAPMVWDRKKWDMDLLAHTRRLVRLRRDHPVFSAGRWKPLLAVNSARVIAYERRIPSGERAIIAVNDGYAPYALRLGSIRSILPPQSFFIQLLKKGLIVRSAG